MPDGWWGGGGHVIRLPDIYELVWPLAPGMQGEPRDAAERVLAERRQARARRVLAAAGHHEAA